MNELSLERVKTIELVANSMIGRIPDTFKRLISVKSKTNKIEI